MQNLTNLNQPVNAQDIDFRVQSINKGGYATILAYKDARYDMRILDEVAGVGLWQKDYKIIDGNLYCGIGVYVEGLQQWVWKWDVGVESNTEKEKGQASDAQKRAGFAWGIGRELYDFPLIQVKLKPNEFEVRADGRAQQTYNLKLRDWTWTIERGTDLKIYNLIAKDQDGEVRFQSGKPSGDVGSNKAPSKAVATAKSSNIVTKKDDGIATPDQINTLRDLVKVMPSSDDKLNVIKEIKGGITKMRASQIIDELMSRFSIPNPSNA